MRASVVDVVNYAPKKGTQRRELRAPRCVLMLLFWALRRLRRTSDAATQGHRTKTTELPLRTKGLKPICVRKSSAPESLFFLPFTMLCEYFHVYTAQQMLVLIATKVHASD